MKAYKIEMMTITANTKKEAVEMYLVQHFESYMYKCDKKFSTLYRKAKIMICTFDVVFNDDESSNSMGFKASEKYCRDYIKANNGSSNGYFCDYKGGIVSVVCNETGQTMCFFEIK